MPPNAANRRCFLQNHHSQAVGDTGGAKDEPCEATTNDCGVCLLWRQTGQINNFIQGGFSST